MRRLTVVLAMLALLGPALPAAASRGSARVTNDLDSGPGSLRAAMESGRSPIVVRPGVGDIEIDTSLVWSATDDLVIHGHGQTVTDLDGSVDGALLIVAEGADTSIRRLSLQGPGGFDIDNMGGGNALRVVVPADARGTVHVDLERVSISDVGLHGVHVDDLINASRASIHLSLNRSTVTNVGTGGFDQDGIRVDERGDGDITFESSRSTFERAGADGVELDEGGDGDVVARVSRTGFEANGNYCSFRFDEEQLEGIELLDDFDELAIVIDPSDEQAVRELFDPNEVECLEFAEEDGELEVAIDIDDAFDVDEADDGSIWSKISNTSLIESEDEGLDYDETGRGHIVASVSRVDAAGNTDEAIKYTEDGPGNVVATSKRVDGEDQDVEFEEFDDGHLESVLSWSDLADLSLVEEDAGHLRSNITRSTLDDIEGEETGDGHLHAGFNRSRLDVVELTQEDGGSGLARFVRSTYDKGASTFNGVTVD